MLEFWGDVSCLLVEFETDYEERKQEERLGTLVPFDLSSDDVSRSKRFCPGAVVPYSLSTLNEKPRGDTISQKAKRELLAIRQKKEEDMRRVEEAKHALVERLEKQKIAVRSQFEKRRI